MPTREKVQGALAWCRLSGRERFETAHMQEGVIDTLASAVQEVMEAGDRGEECNTAGHNYHSCNDSTISGLGSCGAYFKSCQPVSLIARPEWAKGEK